MRLACIGSHGVGKTTLVRSIGLPKGYQVINETSREIIAIYKKVYNKLPHEMTEEERFHFQWDVVQAHIEAEQRAGDCFLADRAVYDILVYCQDLPKERYLQIEKTFLKQACSYDALFYLPIEFPLVLDDVRKADEAYRQLIDTRLLAFLKQLSVPYIELRGTPEVRVELFFEHLFRLF